MSATIEDIDGDGRPDTEFSAAGAGRLTFGIRTASGATVLLAYDLAGPGEHRGWVARFASGPPLAVLEDGRNATVHAFVDCHFVTPSGTNGEQYQFTLNGFGEYGTGVECRGDTAATRTLEGVLATKEKSGRYSITTTDVHVSANGRTATNGTRRTLSGTFGSDSAEVRDADTSSCGSIPIVHNNLD